MTGIAHPVPGRMAARMAVAAPVLEAQNVERAHAPDFAVRIADLAVAPGETWVFDAPSGAGKSTALALLGGALAPTGPRQGTVLRLSGRDFGGQGRYGIDGADPADIAFVLQTGGLIPFLDVATNIRLPLRLRGRGPEPDWAARLVARLGLADLGARLPETLSVGQRQRVAIARAFLARPRVLLLDEPVSALDPDNAARVAALLAELCAETGAAALVAAHGGQGGSFAQAPRVSFATRRADGRRVSVFWNRGGAP